ncbi:MAG TPA: hypothetical protein VFK52_09210 [Nocardioidaceae bacterium]|nr:hypothetical protein [Nocardioidaceae bacterium]
MSLHRGANLNQFQRNDRDLLRWLIDGADVVHLVECIRADGTPVPIARWLPNHWATNHDTTTEGMSGSCVCWNTRTMTAHWRRLTLAIDPYINGRRVAMRPRYLSEVALTEKATGKRERNIAGHAAPGRYAATHPQFDAALGLRMGLKLRAPAIAYVDLNRDPSAYAREHGLEAHGVGVTAFLTDPRRLEVPHSDASRHGIRLDATDHHTLEATIHRKRRHHA